MQLNVFEEKYIQSKDLPPEWQSRNSLNGLEDFLQFNWEQRAVYYDDRKITGKQQFLVFGQNGIRTQNYIGTVVFKGQQLNIFPKMFRTERSDEDVNGLELRHLMKNLVQWLEYCTKVEYPFIKITGGLEDSDNLKELFVTLYVRYVKSALDRGLFYRYEERTGDCTAIKGKADYKDYFIKKYPAGRWDKFSCTYSEFESDNTLNRIIKYTCKELLNENSGNGVSARNVKILRRILMKLNGVSDVRCVPADCDTVRLSKLHGNYSVILSMSKMFLLNRTSSYNVDDTESFCFLFPTELLFEGFIYGFMKTTLAGVANVVGQASELSVFSDVRYAGKSLGKTLTMRNDILVEHNDRGVFLFDTKYKMIDRFEGNEDVRRTLIGEVCMSDIYQVLTYARVRRLKDVYLLYPMFRNEEPETDSPVGINTTVSGEDPINVHLVRLPFVFGEDTEKTKTELRQAIVRIFESEEYNACLFNGF